MATEVTSSREATSNLGVPISTMPESRASSSPTFVVQSAPKSRLEVAADLTKAVAWPFVVVFIVAVFWTPLHELAHRAPLLIDQSESITIAGVSIKLDQRLKGKASPDISKALAAMSPESIRRLLGTTSSFWDSNISDAREENSQLLSLGLVEEIPPNELNGFSGQQGRRYDFGIRLTERGRQVQEFLFTLISEFARQLHVS